MAAAGRFDRYILPLRNRRRAAKTAQRVRPRHDGVYAVDVFTSQGGCDKVYHWTITVSAGQIRSAADGFMQASGEITPRGVVSLAFRHDAQVANVTGQVRDKVGWGNWTSPTLRCSGTWGAAREDGPAQTATVTALSR